MKHFIPLTAVAMQAENFLQTIIIDGNRTSIVFRPMWQIIPMVRNDETPF